MRSLRIVLFLLAMLILTTQATRHIYVRYLEPRSSVLDRFNETDTKKFIQEAKTLPDLVREYEPAKKRADELEAELKRELADKSQEERYPFEAKWREEHQQELERESALRQAIQDWEEKSHEILELRVFWLFGLGFFLLGALLLAKHKQYLGMALLIPGVTEMIWWTSPSLRMMGCLEEYQRLLDNRLAFTLVTLVLVLIAWGLGERQPRSQGKPA